MSSTITTHSMTICLRGMLNNIIRDNVKKKDRGYVEAILINQLYHDLQLSLKCKTPEECQEFVNEIIRFYCLKEN